MSEELRMKHRAIAIQKSELVTAMDDKNDERIASLIAQLVELRIQAMDLEEREIVLKKLNERYRKVA